MKAFTFYRLNYFNMNYCGNGEECPRAYKWFTSRASAQRAAAAWRRSSKDDFEYDPDEPDSLRKSELKVITITPTKAGLLDALNQYARDDVTVY